MTEDLLQDHVSSSLSSHKHLAGGVEFLQQVRWQGFGVV